MGRGRDEIEADSGDEEPDSDAVGDDEEEKQTAIGP